MRLGVTRFLLALFALLTLVTSSASAQSVTVTMLASNDSPEVGETIQLQIEARIVGGQVGGTLVPPAFGNLRVVGTTGEMHSQSFRQSYSGRPEIESRTIIGYMLVADRPGVYTIAGANFRYGRRTETADPLVIKVGGSSTAVVDPPAAQNAPGGDVYEYDRDIFLRATIDKTEPYVGEQVTYTLYLYTRIEGDPTITRRASTDGFWMQSLLPPQRQLTPEFQTVRGNHYRVYAIDRLALFPERTGPLEIGSAELEIELGGMMGRMMGNSETIRRLVPPLSLTAKPLPAGAGREAILGSAAISAELDRSAVSTGEASTLTITISADASLRNAEVALPAIDGVRVEPPSITDEVDTNRDRVSGARRIRYQLVPLRPGTFTIPPFSITTVEPETGTVARVSTEALTIVATGVAIEEPSVEPGEIEENEDEPSDDALAFGPASARAEMRRATPPIHARPYFLPLLIAPILGLMLLLCARSIRDAIELRRSSAGDRSKRSSKKPLAEARKAKSRGDAGAFYAALASALHVSMEKATSAPSNGMTHPELAQHLVSRGFEQELVDRIVDELDGADFARFGATSTSKDELDRALVRAQALIDRIERTKTAGGEP